MPERIVVHISTSLTLTPGQFAAMLLRAEAEKHPEIVAALDAQSQYEEALATSAPKPPADPAPAPAETPVEAPEPPPVSEPPAEPPPAAARSGRPPRANGKAAPVKAAPEPEPDPEPAKPLEEAEVRAVLRLFSTIVPGRDAAVVALLQDVGGAPRLTDCDREKWPAIIAAAQHGIAQHAKPA